jgi:mRNA interferase RelE/StbE
MYQVVLTKQAEKSFNQLMKSNPKMGTRVGNAIDELSQNPEIGIALRGDLKGLFKHRIGTYRVIYEIVKSKLVITVIDIGHRKEVYR